jgi:hypothetical protein
MLTPEEIQARLADRNLAAVARATGLHADTVRKYARGEAVDPPFTVVKVLSDYLTGVGR